jgi:hypothetical protein
MKKRTSFLSIQIPANDKNFNGLMKISANILNLPTSFFKDHHKTTRIVQWNENGNEKSLQNWAILVNTWNDFVPFSGT